VFDSSSNLKHGESACNKKHSNISVNLHLSGISHRYPSNRSILGEGV